MNALIKTSIVTGMIGLFLIVLSNMINWSDGIAAFLGGGFMLIVSAASGIAGLIVRANQSTRTRPMDNRNS